MIYHYGITQQGAYHVDKNIVCQDAHKFKLINNDFAIAAVADGLGSELHSDVASKTAVQHSVDFCTEKINGNENDEKIIDIIRQSFLSSLDLICKIANENGDDIDQYDTTLTLVVYLNGNVYYGNAGDSGIVVLNENGRYEKLTEQQRDEDGRVFPLWFGEEKWVFGIKKRVSSVLMATDGIYETLFPFLLRNNETTIYVALAHYLMSEDSLRFKDLKEESVQERMEQFVSNIPHNQVNDDKTLLVMVNTSIVPSRLDEDYYKSPNWEQLKKKHDEEYKKIAYPHLFNESQNEINASEDENKETDMSLKETITRIGEKVIDKISKML